MGEKSATIVFDAAKVITATLEPLDPKQQALAIRYASEAIGLKPQSQSEPAAGSNQSPTGIRPSGEHTHNRPADIEQFTAARAPKTDQQFAAVVAYYYQFEAPEDERRDSIDAATLKKAARLVGRRQPKNPQQTLRNAKNSGYLDSTATSGSYTLNAVGENLVALTLGSNSEGDGGKTKGTTKKKHAQKKGAKKKKKRGHGKGRRAKAGS